MHRNIIILGLVSLCTDISSEMIYPLIPLYLTGVMGASPALLGIIEGLAESMTSLLKLVSGRVADRFQNRKGLAIAGYGLSAAGKILFVTATSWTGIFWARMNDRLGKGIRTAPRDALIAETADSESRGKAFGFHRAMDTAGAVIGIFLAYVLFTCYQGDYRLLFLVAVILAAMGVALLFLVQEQAHPLITKGKGLVFSWSGLDRRLQWFLVISLIFNLGNSSNQFLLLRAGVSGFTPAQVILLYLLMNLSYLLASYPAGRLSDRIGRRNLLTAGYGIYGAVYLGFARVENMETMVLLFALYGIYIGLTEGVEKALLADMAPLEQKATVYGLHALLVGIALLPASILAGWLWDYAGMAAPFYLGGVSGLAAAGAIWFGLHVKDKGIEVVN